MLWIFSFLSNSWLLSLKTLDSDVSLESAVHPNTHTLLRDFICRSFRQKWSHFFQIVVCREVIADAIWTERKRHISRSGRYLHFLKTSFLCFLHLLASLLWTRSANTVSAPSVGAAMAILPLLVFPGRIPPACLFPHGDNRLSFLQCCASPCVTSVSLGAKTS